MDYCNHTTRNSKAKTPNSEKPEPWKYCLCCKTEPTIEIFKQNLYIFPLYGICTRPNLEEISASLCQRQSLGVQTFKSAVETPN